MFVIDEKLKSIDLLTDATADIVIQLFNERNNCECGELSEHNSQLHWGENKLLVGLESIEKKNEEKRVLAAMRDMIIV